MDLTFTIRNVINDLSLTALGLITFFWPQVNNSVHTTCIHLFVLITFSLVCHANPHRD